MHKPNRTIPDLSSNVLKLSFMRPSLQAAEKAKVIKEDKNKLNITFELPDRILKKIEESLKRTKNPQLIEKETNILVLSKLPRGLRLSYGGCNLETEKQMARKEININNYEDDADSNEEYSISVSEMKEFSLKNRKKHHVNKRRNNELEDGEISERKSKKKITN